MTAEFLERARRGPRHDGGAAGSARILVEQPDGRAAEVLDVINFSRQGAKLVLSAPVDESEDVELHVVSDANEESAFELRIPAAVRWQENDAGDTCRVGCRFHTELNWEAFGELFLHGVIAVE